MKRVVAFFLIFALENVSGIDNVTLSSDFVGRQLLNFKVNHPDPIGILQTSAGKPVGVRETVTLNTNVFNNQHFWDLQTRYERKKDQHFWDLQTSAEHERIPERSVHARGTGAYGYFQVTNDVSNYTQADVFNDIGKKTPVLVRFSYLIQNIGGLDLIRETAALVAKFYTNEGNLDLLSSSFPAFLYNTPHLFNPSSHAFGRNPRTNLHDSTSRIDFATRSPEIINHLLWLLSDYGISNGYRKMDAFPLHTYEIVNKHGESYFVKFNFRTEQGLELLTERAATALRSIDPDYSTRDLYDAIATGNYPSWRLDMDVIPKHKITKLDYNPFDVTVLWRNGTYHTVTIGRLVLNRNPDNMFKDIEQAAFNPGNLVPGIPGPRDDMFKARRFAYRDAQNYRLGINHNNIPVNHPKNKKLYNRDGVAPVLDDMRDAPNYYQNSFNGPAPFVDETRPKESLSIKFRQAVDLEEAAYFYKTYVNTEGKKNRMAANFAGIAVNAIESMQKELLRLLFLIDRDLGQRTELALQVAKVLLVAQRPKLQVVKEHPKTLDLIPNVC